jgi:hypothetical protein
MVKTSLIWGSQSEDVRGARRISSTHSNGAQATGEGPGPADAEIKVCRHRYSNPVPECPGQVLTYRAGLCKLHVTFKVALKHEYDSRR